MPDARKTDLSRIARTLCAVTQQLAELVGELVDDAEPPSFVPSAFQCAILRALDCRALRTDELGRIVGDRRRLFRHPGGLPELQDEGLVAHHRRIGYYRPDAKPDLPDIFSRENTTI